MHKKRGRKNHQKGSDKGKPKGSKHTRNKGAGKKLTQQHFEDKGEEIRLNKFIAHSGICSRREADTFIKAGVVKVNGKIVTEMGVKIKPTDIVHFEDQLISGERPVYVLLNKPKDYITSTKDPRGRKTVMMLVEKACKERIFPVGRLDRNTTGLLLFTNDGEMTHKLLHPKNEVKKIYKVETAQNVKPSDLEKLVEGVQLDDGKVQADQASYVDGDKSKIGIEIHSGKNRVIRRMFEAIGYKITKLDRVYFAGLTKKDLPRGRYRFLTEQEIANLKML